MGSILGPDQIRKINAAYFPLVIHVRSLLEKDHTGVGLMNVHRMIESFDSDQMAAIFRDLSFISPLEKKALVRAAIYEVMVIAPELFLATPDILPVLRPVVSESSAPKSFTPPQFRLNVNPSESFHGQKPADTPAPAPVVTSTHTSKVAAQLKAGEIAAAKLREASKPIELLDVPADANLQARIDEIAAVDSTIVSE